MLLGSEQIGRLKNKPPEGIQRQCHERMQQNGTLLATSGNKKRRETCKLSNCANKHGRSALSLHYACSRKLNYSSIIVKSVSQIEYLQRNLYIIKWISKHKSGQKEKRMTAASDR